MRLSTVPINFLENWEFIKLASGGVLETIIGFLQPLQSHQPNPSPTFAGTMSSPTYEHKVQCCKVRHCKHTQVPPISHQAQSSHCNRSRNNWAPRLHVERRAWANVQNVQKLFKQLSTISYLPSRFLQKWVPLLVYFTDIVGKIKTQKVIGDLSCWHYIH